MKIVHTSDLHIGHLINTIERESEFLELFDWLSQKINKLKPDAFIIAGDIFDQYFPSNSALELYYNFLLSLRDSVEKIIVVGGNHDSFKTLKAPKEILKLLNIVVVSGSEDNYYEIVEFKDFVIVAVSYLRESILKKYDSSLNIAIKKIYQELLLKAKKSYPNKKIVATGHLTIKGASLSDSERELYIGNIEAISSSIFKGYDYVALGHIHRAQKIDQNIFYSGSPLPLSFNENYQKKIIYIENEKVNFINVPRFREFIRLNGSFKEVLEKIKNIKNSFIEINLNEIVDSSHLKILRESPNIIVKITLPYKNEVSLNQTIKNITPYDIVKEIFKEEKEILKEFLEIQREVEDEFGKVED